MSSGVPGYDFTATEVVTAAKLQTWLRDAVFQDISYSEASSDLAGLVRSTVDPGGSEGRLWYNPTTKVLQVQGRWGWTPIFNPFMWMTRRMKVRDKNNQIGIRMESFTTGYPPGSGVATTGNFTLQQMVMVNSGRINVFKGDHQASFVLQETCVSNANPLMLGWGVGVGYMVSGTARDIMKGVDTTGRFNPQTSTTQGGWGLVATLLGATDMSFATNWHRPIFWAEGPLEIAEEGTV